jgi:polyferredoxin
MALERPYEKEQMERNARLDRQARRDYWRDILRTMLHLAFWVAVGLGLMGSALHTRDAALGGVLWLAGQTLWLSGVLFSLLAAYRRGSRRGDW